MEELKYVINTISLADALAGLRSLPDKSVHVIVTSPPYWNLRDYGIKGQLGLEDTPEEFIANMVLIFREAYRVLRDDGTLWVNIGDSYTGYKANTGDTDFARYRNRPEYKQGWQYGSLKQKDMVGIPWMLAFALRADGWYLRQDIIWHKPNPMPESIRDRCTKAHEYIFMFSKSERYFFDATAIATPITEVWKTKYAWSSAIDGSVDDCRKGDGQIIRKEKSGGKKEVDQTALGEGMANRRSVWTIPTQAFKEAHFATFPEELPSLCIRAGTSSFGVCSVCGAPYYRVTEKQLKPLKSAPKNFIVKERDFLADKQDQGSNRAKDGHKKGHYNEVKTLGWEPSCECNAPIGKAVVLDPFSGAATTALTARKLGRSSIGFELNPEYIEIGNKRLQKELGLFI